MTDDYTVKEDRCEPNMPCPQPEPRDCEGDITLQGKLVMECCCPQLRTKTFIINIGPQTEASLFTFLQNTVDSWESNGYLVMAHSLVDTGAGWGLGLTVGYYAFP